ncbi:hypothetical protein [Tolypothrix sp. VBCCA 56010]|uniref:hypothetical protein n=1 Tax=Tolypothrix sp. VBCCA 56010 TaxID=3137731 RepID=UPI003D7D3F67
MILKALGQTREQKSVLIWHRANRDRSLFVADIRTLALYALNIAVRNYPILRRKEKSCRQSAIAHLGSSSIPFHSEYLIHAMPMTFRKT